MLNPGGGACCWEGAVGAKEEALGLKVKLLALGFRAGLLCCGLGCCTRRTGGGGMLSSHESPILIS